MSDFYTSDELSTEISGILSKKSARVAVAFWGTGAETRFPGKNLKNFKIICNLAQGGTNPQVIETLLGRGAQVRQCDTLHAKVYIGQESAIVASANNSINGLGLQGVEQANWLEAGVKIGASAPGEWFNTLWDSSSVRPITPADLEAAKKVFKGRSNHKPSVPFANFDAEAANLPLVSWYQDGNTVEDVEAVGQWLNIPNNDAQARLDAGLEIYDPEIENFDPFTWCLHYRLTKNGQAHGGVTPNWSCLAGRDYIAKDIRTYEDEDGRTVSMMVTVEDEPPLPFPVTSKFRQVFVEVINQDDFLDLREKDFKNAFFTPERIELIRKFWPALKSAYIEQPGQA